MMPTCADCGREFVTASEYKVYNGALICRSPKVCDGLAKMRRKKKPVKPVKPVTDHELDRRAAEWLRVQSA